MSSLTLLLPRMPGPPTALAPTDLSATDTATDPLAPLSSSFLVTNTQLVINTAAPTLLPSSSSSSDTPDSSPPSPSPSSSSSALPTSALAGIIAGGAVLLLAILVCGIYLCRRRRNRHDTARHGWGPGKERERKRMRSLGSRSSFGFTINRDRDGNRPSRPDRAPSPSFYDRGPGPSTLDIDDTDSIFSRIFNSHGAPSTRTRTEETAGGMQTDTGTSTYFTSPEDLPTPPLPPTPAAHPRPTITLTSNLNYAYNNAYPPASPLSRFSKYSPGRSYAPSLSSSSYFSFRTFQSQTSTSQSALVPSGDGASEVQLAPMLPNFPTPPSTAGREEDRLRERWRERERERERAQRDREGQGQRGRGTEWVSELEAGVTDSEAEGPADADKMRRLLTALEVGTDRLPPTGAFRHPLVTGPGRI